MSLARLTQREGRHASITSASIASCQQFPLRQALNGVHEVLARKYANPNMAMRSGSPFQRLVDVGEGNQLNCKHEHA